MENKVANLVAELLLSQKRHRLPINPLGLEYSASIKFITIEKYIQNTINTAQGISEFDELNDGVTVKKNKTNIILFNDSCKSKSRQLFTIAHEIGHVVLEHSKDHEQEELEANLFASELLMPRVLVRELKKVYSPADCCSLGRFFGVSRSMINNRIRTNENEFEPSMKEVYLLKIYRNFLPMPNMPLITV